MDDEDLHVPYLADRIKQELDELFKELDEEVEREKLDKRVEIAKALQIINEEHSDTLKALAESERKDRDLEHTLEMAEHVWQKVKGYPIPESYSKEDRLSIFERYYHRASAQSQGE